MCFVNSAAGVQDKHQSFTGGGRLQEGSRGPFTRTVNCRTQLDWRAPTTTATTREHHWSSAHFSLEFTTGEPPSMEDWKTNGELYCRSLHWRMLLETRTPLKSSYGTLRRRTEELHWTIALEKWSHPVENSTTELK